MQAETAGHHSGQKRAYYRRLIRLVPGLTRRALRINNLLYHTERSARIFEINAKKYVERPLIKAGERLPSGVRKVFDWILGE